LCLREEGCLEENGTYSVSDLAHHLPNHITVEVHASERKYQGVVTEMGEKVTMCVYQV
jgi:hypothetical protein